VEIGFWLTAAESALLGAWCQLSVEVEEDLGEMQAAKINAWRMMGAELGFSPTARTRLSGGGSRLSKEDEALAKKYLG